MSRVVEVSRLICYVFKARTQEARSWASTGETCVLYCGHGSGNAGQGMAKMPRDTDQCNCGNDGKLDGREGRVHQMHVDWEMRLKVRPILMCWRMSLPVDTTAEAGPTPPQQHGGDAPS